LKKIYTHYGDEITFGGGKVIRDGMGQSSTRKRENRARRARSGDHQRGDHRSLGHRQSGYRRRDGRIVKSAKPEIRIR
jgi:urease alpha subunit